MSSLSNNCEESRLLTQTYGWSLIGGGSLDTMADFIGNSRTPLDVITMPDVIYSYGYNLGYGLGFAGPFLLPTYVGSCSFTCSSQDFLAVVQKYGLTYGVGRAGHLGESKLHNFGSDAKEAISCLLGEKGSSKEAAQVDFAIDDLVEAGQQIVRLQRRIGNP